MEAGKLRAHHATFGLLKEMFGKVNRSFRTLNDCDMLCSGDAKCWHHVCSLFVTLLAQLGGWAIDRRTRHSGCQSAPWVQIFRSLPWCREDGRGMSGRVRRLFQVLLISILHLTPHFSFLFLFYFLLNKINNSGKRLLWLVKVFLEERGH